MKYEVARPVGQLLVAVSVFLILVPLVNVGLQVVPWRPGDQNWRFGAWGFLLGAMTFPVVGIALLGVGGSVRESRPVVRVALLLASLLLVGAVVGLVDFLIQGTALKAAATEPTMIALFKQEIRRTAFVSVVAIPALAAMTFGSYKLLKGIQHALEQNQGSSPLIHTGER